MDMSKSCKKRINYSRQKRFLKNEYGIILLILLFFLMTSLFLLLYTDFFMIKEIEVIGNEYLDENDILRNSNLEIGMNIFKFNRSNIERNIIMHSFIKDAKLSRHYP